MNIEREPDGVRFTHDNGCERHCEVFITEGDPNWHDVLIGRRTVLEKLRWNDALDFAYHLLSYSSDRPIRLAKLAIRAATNWGDGEQRFELFENHSGFFSVFESDESLAMEVQKIGTHVEPQRDVSLVNVQVKTDVLRSTRRTARTRLDDIINLQTHRNRGLRAWSLLNHRERDETARAVSFAVDSRSDNTANLEPFWPAMLSVNRVDEFQFIQAVGDLAKVISETSYSLNYPGDSEASSDLDRIAVDLAGRVFSEAGEPAVKEKARAIVRQTTLDQGR